MEKVFSTPRLRKFKNHIEKALDVKIYFEDDTAMIEGEGLESYTSLSVIEALNFGFDFNVAIQLKNEDYMIEKLNLRRYVREGRISTVKGRIIGLKGKTKKILSRLSDCDIALKDNIVAIIGKTSDVDICARAVRSLIQGSPHSSVYAFLEKNRKMKKENIEDEI